MKLRNILAVGLAAMLLSSCRSHQNTLAYFVELEKEQPVAMGQYLPPIVPGDQLLISVQSTFTTTTADYNYTTPNGAEIAYQVDSKGDINYPKLGMLHVEGLTTEQLRDLLTEKISKFVRDPLVKVTISNFIVDVAGEVRSPQRLNATGERFSVLDALTAAGDLTPYGRRDNVLILREENGKRVAHRLNLNDPATLASPYFYLRQNDYVYVEPTSVREENAEYDQNRSFKLSVVSTIVSGVSVVVSLLIALVAK